MPVNVFRQENGRFVNRTVEAGLAGTSGWWNTVASVDLRGNGRTDLVLGNLGLNSYLRATASAPARLYVGDFAHNGSLAQILTSYKGGVSYPIAGRDELIAAMPALRSRYATYKDFGASTIESLLSKQDAAAAKLLEAKTFASAIALSDGRGKFELRPLPIEAQFSTVNAVITADFDDDSRTDVLLGGNFYGVPPVQGRYDASHGLMLRGNGRGELQAVDMTTDNLAIDGQVRHMRLLHAANGDRLVIVARNDTTLQLLRVRRASNGRIARSVR
jgi:hypothetical protein